MYKMLVTIMYVQNLIVLGLLYIAIALAYSFYMDVLHSLSKSNLIQVSKLVVLSLNRKENANW